MIRKTIKKCVKHDHKAQKELYHYLKDKVMGVCARYFKDKEEAKDIFQEVMIKIFRNIKDLKNPEAIDSWARRISVTTCINYLKTKNTLHLSLEVINGNNYSVHDADILSQLTTEELLNCINELPRSCRLSFNMFVIDGYTHKEIAGILDISENTSKSNLRDAKILLIKMLKKKGFIIKKYA